jgi:hypothetical protein
VCVFTRSTRCSRTSSFKTCPRALKCSRCEQRLALSTLTTFRDEKDSENPE